MHYLTGPIIASQIVEDRIQSASRARRFRRVRRRFTRGERRGSPSSPIPGRLRVAR